MRYFSYGHAETPELYTQDIVTGYANAVASQDVNVGKGMLFGFGFFVDSGFFVFLFSKS